MNILEASITLITLVDQLIVPPNDITINRLAFFVPLLFHSPCFTFSRYS